MATRIAGALVGLVFGFMLCWSGMVSPDVIRGALLFEDSYLFLFFASAVFTAVAGLAIVRRAKPRAALTGEPVQWTNETVERRHVVGAAMFGVGWGVANVCPGPVAAQVGQGIAWSLVTLAGVVVGVYVYLRRGQAETEPASEASGAGDRAQAQPAATAPVPS